MSRWLGLAVMWGSCQVAPAFHSDARRTEDGPAVDGGPRVVRPVLLIHGIAGSAADFAVMANAFSAAGWPADWVIARSFDEPQWGCNVDNAATIAGWVEEALRATGAASIDIVAHSMGSLSSRYFVRKLMGPQSVTHYVSLGGMHQGQATACLAPQGLQCTWDELCGSRAFLQDLNTAPVTPGPTTWFSFCGDADETVSSAATMLAGASHACFAGVTHSGATGLLESPLVFAAVLAALAP